MDFDEEQQAAAIAAEWGVDVALLEQASWTLQTIDGADGELYGYVVRFDDDDTPPDVLTKLGLRFGQLERELSINAFDEPDEGGYGSGRYGSGTYGGESYPLDEPFPDLSDLGESEPSETTNEPVTRPTAGTNFSTSSFSNFTFAEASHGRSNANEDYLVAGDGNYIVDSQGNRITVGRRQHGDVNTAYREELAAGLARIEAALEVYTSNIPDRAHNNPPELLESDPIEGSDVKLLAEAVRELKQTLKEGRPDPKTLEANAALFRRIAGAIAGWCGRKADKTVDVAIQWGVPIGLTWAAAHPQDVQAALEAVADTASNWAQYLQGFLT